MAETPQGSIVVVADMGARNPGEEVPLVEVQKTGVGLVLHSDPAKGSKKNLISTQVGFPGLSHSTENL